MARRNPASLPGIVWSGWAGANSEYVTTREDDDPRGLVITTLQDLSGNDNHCVENTAVFRPPTYRVGAFHGFGTWKTSLPLLHGHRYGDENSNGNQTFGGYMDFTTPIVFPGPFVCFFVMVGDRNNNGRYDLLGNTPANFMQHRDVDTTRGLLGEAWLAVDGFEQQIAANAEVGGPGILRIERDASDAVSVWWNRTEITTAGLSPMPGTFTAGGWGYKGSGGSQLDNHLLEMAFVNGTVTAKHVEEVEHFWNVRWGVFNSFPEVAPTGSRRISPFTDVEHAWLEKGTNPASVAGLLERWTSAQNQWRAYSNADRLATHSVPETGTKIRPMHTQRLDELGVPAYPGSVYRPPHSTFFNEYGWSFFKQFVFRETSTAPVLIPPFSAKDHWVDIKRDTPGSGSGHREFTWPMFDVYMRGTDAQQRVAWEGLQRMSRCTLERRPFSHINEPVAGQYMPFKGTAQSVNEADCNIKPESGNYCAPIDHQSREWGWQQNWRELEEHVSNGAWPGSWDGTINFEDGELEGDDSEVEYYSFEGWNATDRGHNTTTRYLAGALAGHPESYTILWQIWRLVQASYTTWSSDAHMCSQPREGFFAIDLAINAELAGFGYSDPELRAEQIAYWNGSFPNGITPVEWMQYILPRLLTDRWTGGIGSSFAGTHLDSSNDNVGSNNVMQELCGAAKTDVGGDDWWVYEGSPHFRRPAYGRFVWQPSWLLLGFAKARRFYEWYEEVNGVAPFSSAVYTGLGEALTYYHAYLADRAVTVEPSSLGDPPGSVAYMTTVDKYHNSADQAVAGNPHAHRSYDPITVPGQPLAVWEALRDSFFDTCGNDKWEDTNPGGQSNVRFSRHPSSGLYYAWRGDNTNTGAFSYVPSRALWVGPNDPLLQLVVEGPEWRVRENSQDWFSIWAKFADLYYVLLDHAEDDDEEPPPPVEDTVIYCFRGPITPEGLGRDHGHCMVFAIADDGVQLASAEATAMEGDARAQIGVSSTARSGKYRAHAVSRGLAPTGYRLQWVSSTESATGLKFRTAYALWLRENFVQIAAEAAQGDYTQ